MVDIAAKLKVNKNCRKNLNIFHWFKVTYSLIVTHTFFCGLLLYFYTEKQILKGICLFVCVTDQHYVDFLHLLKCNRERT